MKTKQHLLLIALLLVSNLFVSLAQDKKAAVNIQFDNPVKSGQDLTLVVDQTTDVEIMLLNPKDQFVKLLLKQELMAGTHDIPVIVSDVQAGDYKLQLVTPKGKQTKAFTVVHQPKSVASLSTPTEASIPAKPWLTKTITKGKAMVKEANKIKGIGKNYTLMLTNPAKSGDDLSLKVDQLTDFKVTILDKDNKFVKLLMHQELMAGEHEIPMILSDLQAGSYWLNIDANGETKTQALEIKH